MMALIVTLAIALIATVILKHFYCLPDTEELRVVGLAAGDEGDDISKHGIRLATNDVVDLDVYTPLRYHKFMSHRKFKGTDEEQIAAEAGCGKFEIVPAGSSVSE
jgi:hypothetical protein